MDEVVTETLQVADAITPVDIPDCANWGNSGDGCNSLAEEHPVASQHVANGAAGFLDGFAGGVGEELILSNLDITAGKYDPDSKVFTGGQVAGTVTSIAVSGGTASAASSSGRFTVQGVAAAQRGRQIAGGAHTVLNVSNNIGDYRNGSIGGGELAVLLAIDVVTVGLGARYGPVFDSVGARIGRNLAGRAQILYAQSIGRTGISGWVTRAATWTTARASLAGTGDTDIVQGTIESFVFGGATSGIR